MSTPQDSDSDNWPLEDLLQQLPLRQPSARLDARIASLLRPAPTAAWPRFLGPFIGFAAGLILAVALIPAYLHKTPTHGSVPIPTITTPEAAPPAQPLLVEARQAREFSQANLDGVPVRLESTQTRLLFYRDGPDGRQYQGEASLPQTTQLQPVEHY